MDFLQNYLTSNIPLFAVSAVMIFIAFRNIKIRKGESIYFLIFTSIVLLLSVVVSMEKYSQAKGLVVVGTIFTSLGYIFRPILLYFFVLLANMDHKRSKKFYLIAVIPLIVNTVVYILPLMFHVPVISKLIFYYELQSTGEAIFVRGSFLNFFSHMVCLIFLILLIYVSTLRFHGKHRRDGLVIVLVVIFIVITVAAEMLTGRNDLLNIVCEICALINYVFIMSINTSRDPLTNLYDRRTYYEDISKFRNLVNGIIQIDVNELKYLNDNYGHTVGDSALHELARIFEDNIDRDTMCAYRLSGDEFLILMFQGKKEQLDTVVETIKQKIKESNYSVAIGALFIAERTEDKSFEDYMRIAEEIMYEDKAKHYQETGNERRRK